MNFRELMKRANEKGVGRDLTPLFMEFKKDGDNIVGKFVAVSSVQSGISDGTYNQYLFETDEGLIKFHLGAATDKEVLPNMVVGKIYSIAYRGKERIQGGRSVNKWKVVEIDPSLIETSYDKKPIDQKGGKG